jgi:tetratricopeptide (TPR) repeat protein
LDEAHLSLETLARWLAGSLEHEEVVRNVAPHLLARCPRCRERHEELKALQARVGHWSEEVAVFEGREAPELWERIAGRPYPEQRRAVEEEDEFQTWAFCRLLLDKSLEDVFTDPPAAVDRANLAAVAAGHLGEAYHPDWVADLRALAHARLGNARRVLGEMRSADDAFGHARGWLARGTGSPEVEAEVLDLESSLRRNQRRLAEALDLGERALGFYEEAGDARGALIGRIKLAKVLDESGELDRAADLLEDAAARAKEAGELRLHAYARNNLLVCLVHAGRFEEAERRLPEIRELFRESAQLLDLVRLRWTEGQIAHGLGRPGPAEAAFREVQREFLERGMGYDAALVSLDLALLYAQEGCAAELKRLARELMPVFEARDVHREALVTLVLFQNACEEERLTVELARQLADFLRRERRGNGVGLA